MGAARRADAARERTPLARPEAPGRHGRLRAALAAPRDAARAAQQARASGRDRRDQAALAEQRRHRPGPRRGRPGARLRGRRRRGDLGAHRARPFRRLDRRPARRRRERRRSPCCARTSSSTRTRSGRRPTPAPPPCCSSRRRCRRARWAPSSTNATTAASTRCVEVHDADDLERAYSVGATMMGVNNRDLRTLEVDLAVERVPRRPYRSLRAVRQRERHRRPARRAARARRRCPGDPRRRGAHRHSARTSGRSDRRAAWRRPNGRRRAMTRVKICGLTTAKDVKLAASYRAWACGFVLTESPRRVSVAQAAELTPLCGDSLAVAVVATEEPGWIAGAVAAGGFGAVQLSAGADGPSVAAVRAAALSRGLRPLVIAAADTRGRRQGRSDPARRAHAGRLRRYRPTARLESARGRPTCRANAWCWPAACCRPTPMAPSSSCAPSPSTSRAASSAPPASRSPDSCARSSASSPAPISPEVVWRDDREPIRPVRRALRPRDAHPGARRADGGLRRGARRRGLPGRARAPPRRLRRPPHAALPRERLSERCDAPSCSSARTSATPAPTRSTTCSARPFSRGSWARLA